MDEQPLAQHSNAIEVPVQKEIPLTTNSDVRDIENASLSLTKG